MMLFHGDKKKALSAILGPSDKDQPAPEDTLHALAGELIKAVKADDVAGVADALRACYAHCDAEGDEPGGE